MTGVYIPAAKVHAARKWMERTLAVLSPGDRLELEEIERVLAAAEKHGLAYWEATDLDVFDAKSALLEEPEATDVRGSWRVAGGLYQVIARDGDDLFVLRWDDRVVQIDLSRLPPKWREWRFDYLTFAARTKKDEWVLVDRRKDQTPYRFRPFVRSRLQSRSVEMAPEWKSRALVSPFLLGGVLHGVDGDVARPSLLVHSGRTFAPVTGLPKLRRDKPVGCARTGDGVEVLVWDGDGWEKRGGRWRRTLKLGARTSGVSKPSFAADWCSVPAGPNAFAYLSNRLVFRAERGKKPRRLAKNVKNVMRLSPGPSGSILLLMGDNERAWEVAAIRADGSVAGLRAADFAKRGAEAVAFEWSETAGALYVVTGEGIVAVPRSKLGI